MSVQNKILLLLLAIVATLVGGLVALKSAEDRKFRAIAIARAAERNKNFDVFLQERGDNLKALVEDSSTWNDMVRAVVKGDSAWAEQTINDGMLATYKANAIWIYKADRTLFYSRNNRYSENLRELPIPPEAFNTLFASSKVCHFFIQVPQGWMEIRGGTIHPSIDAQRETTPQGFFFAGHIWIDENIRRMSLFTGYDIHIISTADPAVQNVESDERTGLITFKRQVLGWDGKPTASIVVRNESPLIRELNEASERQFLWLMVFSLLLFLTLCASLLLWVRRPLHQLAEGLRTGDPQTVAPLTRRDDEFGHLAELILKFRQTQEALEHAEEQLRHSQKLEAVGRLAGGVAHDFNNLLTAIIGYSELLAPKLNGDPEAHEFVRTIQQAGEKAAGLTRQLLAFSRRQILLPKVLDLNAVVREMDKLLQRVIGEHIRFEIDTSATDARVLADPLQLEQVILNLGVNARDAMPGGGKLKISTENRTEPPCEEAVPCSAGYVLLIVSDTGSGMDAATRERIFEPFFTTKGPGKGTGLGLATVYGIVKQSGGGITVESEIGKGSRFLIHLPRETRAIEEAPAPAPLDATRNAETILVVEDEEVVRQLICAVLREAGYDVLCAGTPTEALDLADRHSGKIDLLVTDVVMPEMHGPTLAEILKKKRTDLAVLFVSGYSENDISDQGVRNAGLDVLQKPFTHQSLIRKVREMLDEASIATPN